jgi:hypothetical protein
MRKVLTWLKARVFNSYCSWKMLFVPLTLAESLRLLDDCIKYGWGGKRHEPWWHYLNW